MKAPEKRRMQEAFGSPETVLHACIRDNKIPKLRRLLADSCAEELAYHDSGFGPPLQVAIACENLVAVGLLLDAGCDPLAEASFEDPPTSGFLLAIRIGNRDVVRRLWYHIEPDIRANGRPRYSAWLVHAAAFGQVSIVDDLLSWCDDWSRNDMDRALQNAAARWEIHVVNLLLSQLAYSQETLLRALQNAVNFKPIMLGEDIGGEYDGIDYLHQQQVIARLVDAGADPNKWPGGQHLTVQAAWSVDLAAGLKMLLEKGADPNGKGDNEQTALHRLGSPVQVRQERECRLHETGIRLLLDYGASVCQPDNQGNTPLHCAAFGSNIRIFSLYLHGVPAEDRDAALAMRNNHRETLAHWAAAGGKIDILQHLLSRDININSTTANGWTPFLCALAPSKAPTKGPPQAVQAARLLLAHGADPHICTAEGWTALHCLALHLDNDAAGDTAKLADDLILRGARVETRAPMLVRDFDKNDRRASHRYAKPWGFLAQAAMQLAEDQPDMVLSDLTPLHWAAYHGAVGVANALLTHGANPSANDANGNTPARLAAESPLLARKVPVSDELIQLLLDAGGSL